MKGAVTLSVYIAIGLIPVAFGPAAVGQTPTLRNSPEAIKQIEAMKPTVRTVPADPGGIPPGSGGIPPGWKRMEIAARPPPIPEHLKPVVLRWEPGGSVPEHEHRFRSLASMGSPVEIRGACISACTLVVSYVPKARLCFGEGSYLSFHAAVSSMETWAYNGEATKRIYQTYPAEIKAWLDGRGGWEKLVVREFWPLFAPELWAMGYARCK